MTGPESDALDLDELARRAADGDREALSALLREIPELIRGAALSPVP